MTIKKYIDFETKKKIRSLFFKQIEMKEIESKVNLSERIIRRVINENDWIKVRERYLRFLCSLSYIHSISLERMAKITGVKKFALGRIHRLYKTPKPKKTAWNKKINDDMEKIFISEYANGYSSRYISKKYGFKREKTVLDVLKKNGIKARPPKRKTYYIKNFFEKIDSPEKAYIYGLIMTDGYIIKDYSGFGIQLTESDGYLLKNIASIIGARQGISKIICNTKRKTMPNTRDMARLSIHNRKIAEDLREKGVTKNKSKTLRYKNSVPKKYLSHFFRGLIDGDGTIGIAKNKNIWCQIVSASKAFIDDLLNIKSAFNLRMNSSVTKYYNKRYKRIKKSRVYIARVSGGNSETIRFLKWIYKDKGDLYLRRKYVKVQDKIN